VYVGVFLHVGLLVKSFATEGARVGAGIAVYEHVGGQGGRPLEALATLLALKAPVLTVHCPVLAEAHRVTEALVAGFTLVGTATSAVRPANMDLKMREHILFIIIIISFIIKYESMKY